MKLLSNETSLDLGSSLNSFSPTRQTHDRTLDIGS